MTIAENPFLEKLRAGVPQIGLWLDMASPVGAEIVAGAGFDWVMIDREHSHTDLATMVHQLQIFGGTGTVPLVRPTWNDPVEVKRILDAGAPGLLFPMVQSADEARAAVAACRYPPEGVRGVAGLTRAADFGRNPRYFAEAAAQIAVLVQAESVATLDAIETLAVEGVDGVFFGPADIAADMGYLDDPGNPAVWDAIHAAAETLMARGVPVGTLVLDPAHARALLARGFTFVGCGADVMLLRQAVDDLAARVRQPD
jgi:4-hydroxy-2-oxoheptanedioate aldolase